MTPFDEALDDVIDEQQAPVAQVAPDVDPAFSAALDTTVKQSTSDSTAKLRESTKQAEQMAPDRAANVYRMSKQLGISPESVNRNYDRYAKSLARDEKPLAEIQASSPHLAEWLQEPAHAAVSQDDLENLGTLEWLLTGPQRAMTKGIFQIEVSRLRTKSMFGELTQREQDQLTAAKNLMTEHERDGSGDSWFRRAVAGTAGQIPNLIATIPAGLQRSAYTIPGAVGVGLGAAAVMGTAPLSIPALMGAGLTAGMMSTGAEFGFQLEAGLAYDEFLAFKDEFGQPIAPEAAKAGAVVAGALNAGLEMVGLGFLARQFPGIEKLTGMAGRNAVRAALRVPTVRSALVEAGKMFGQTLAAETSVEVAQRAFTIMGGELSKIASGQDIAPITGGQFFGDLAEEGVGALEAFALMSLPGPVMGANIDVRRAKLASQNSEFFSALGGAVKASKTGERMPEALQTLIEKATKDGPIETVYAPVESWKAYWQSKGIDPEEMATEVTGNPDALKQAEITGEHLAMPMATYATKLAGTEHNAALSQELKLGDPNAMNAREQKQFIADQKAEAAAAADAADPNKPVLDAVRTEVEQQLQTAITASGLKLPADFASTNAEVWQEMLTTMAANEGIDPVEFLREHLSGIAGPLETDESALAEGDTMSQSAPTELQGEKWEKAKALYAEWGGLEERHGVRMATALKKAGIKLPSRSGAERAAAHKLVEQALNLAHAPAGPTEGPFAQQARRQAVEEKLDANDARAQALALDMTPTWTPESGTVPQQNIPAPRPGEVWFHGGPVGSLDNAVARPLFLTRDKGGAEWFVTNRGDRENVLQSTPVHVENPARMRDLMAAVADVGATEADISENSSYDGTNDIDYVYVPAVREALLARGFDSLLASDVLENGSIEILVPLTGDYAAPKGESEFFQTKQEEEDEAAGITRSNLNVAPAQTVNGRLRLSTRVPSGPDAPTQTEVLRTAMDVALMAPAAKGKESFLVRSARLIRSTITRLPKLGGDTVPLFPQLTDDERANLSDEELVERLVQVMTDNLRWLWDAAAPFADRAKLWYVGAHRISLNMADEFGISPAQAAGVLATLSPQMDWFKNVDLAYRVLRIYQRTSRENTKFTTALFNSYATRQAGGAGSSTRGDKAHVTKQIAQERKDYEGKTWSEMDNLGKAMLLRTLDEEEGFKQYRIITPEGNFGDYVRNQPSKKQLAAGLPGDYGDVGWGTFKFIGNAISILEDGSVQNIHLRVGGEHKVRSFFNNISDPDYAGAVTMDTHANAAALLKPVSGKYLEVEVMMGKGPGSNNVGLQGLNAYFAEAYNRLAEELGVLPREVQSVTWEAVRGLFQDSQKGVPLTRAVDQLWAERSAGKLTVDDFHARLLAAAGGIRPPDWVNTSNATTGDEGVVSPGDARGDAAGVDRRGDSGSGAAGRPGRLALGPDRLHRGVWIQRQDGAKAASPEAVAAEEEEFYQSAAEPSPIFYSRLLAAVTATPMKSATGQKWKGVIHKWAKAAPTPTLGKSWLEGINQAELAITKVDDLEDGKSYTKDEVLQYLSVRTVTVSQVILGDPVSRSLAEADAEKAIMADAQKHYDELAQEIFDSFPPADFEPVVSTFEEDGKLWYQAQVGDQPIEDEVYDTLEEATEAARTEAERRNAAYDSERMVDARNMVDWGDVVEQARENYADINGRDIVVNETQFDTYVTAGAIPGSYREAFVTADEAFTEPVDPEALREVKARYDRDIAIATDTRQVYDKSNLRVAMKARGDGFADTDMEVLKAERKVAGDTWEAAAETARESLAEWQKLEDKSKAPTWFDGHDQYSEIERPIVRVRFNARHGYEVGGDSQPQRVMFLEEVQPPSATEQKDMPALFVKNWREIAFKWALRYAAENGFAAVAWTTGEQQSERYKLSSQVRSINWYPRGHVYGEAPSTATKDVVIHVTRGNASYTAAVNKDGVIEWSPGRNAAWVGEHLSAIIGKDIADQVMAGDKGELTGVGLDVGGEGLRKLYNRDLPNVVNSLPAVRKTNGAVGRFKLGMPTGKVTVRKDDATETRRFRIYQEHATGRYEDHGTFNTREDADAEVARLVDTHRADMAAFKIGVVRFVEPASSWSVLDPTGKFLQRFNTLKAARAFGEAQQAMLDGGTEVPGIAVTPALAERVLGGQTLFQGDDSKRGSTRGPFGRFGGNRKFMIRLFKNADSSTFMHESAHLFLEMLQDLERRPEASARLKADMATLRLWFFGPGGEGTIQEAQHEQFAQAFELYLLEGKAPSIGLQSVFTKFRAWLLRWYKSLSAQVKLTDDVRQVFDRMLATDEAIAAAKAEQKFTPMFTTAEAAGMDAATFALYQEQVAKASTAARETLEAKLLREVRRAQSAAYRQQKDDTRDEVKKEIHQRPVYQALAAIRRGTQPDGTPLVEGVEPQALTLSRQMIVERYGLERLRQLPRGIASDAAGGLDPDVVGQMFGFTGGDQLLQTIVDTPPMATAIADETNARMQQQFGDLILDGKLSDEAKAAVANDGREAIVRAEMRALGQLRRVAAPFVAQGRENVRDEQRERAYERRWFAAEAKLKLAEQKAESKEAIEALRQEVIALRKRARGGPTTVRAGIPDDGLLRQTAIDRIGRTRLRDIKPQTFWVAARQASQKAVELAAKQDFDGAILAKQQELISLALFREATTALAAADARVRQAQQMATPAARSRLGKAGESYQDQVDGILDRYEFARVSQKVLDRRASLRAWVAAIEADGLTVELPEGMLDDARRTHYRELSYDDFIAVTDTLKQIQHLAALKNRLLKAKKARDLQAAASALVASITAHAQPRAKQTIETHLPKEERLRRIHAIFAAHRKMSSLAREMDGHADGGAMFDAIIVPLNDAANTEAEMNAAVTQKLGALVNTAFPGIEKARLYHATFHKEIGQQLTRMGRLMIALNWGNESNRQRVMAGYGWNESQVQALLDTLSATDLEFVQGVWDLINTYWPAIEEKQFRVTGVKPVKVDAVGFTAKNGQVTGGYFPLKYDGRQSPAAQKFIDVEKARLELAGEYVSSTTRRGHTEGRVEKTGPEFKVRLDFGVIFEHIAQVIHDLSHHETLIDVNRLLGHPDVQKAIFDHYGDIVYRQFKEGVTAVAVGQPAVAEHEKMFNHMRVGTTVALLAWNLTTVVMQPLGLTQSMSRVGIKWVGLGLGRWITDAARLENTVAWINDRSSFMKLRGQTQQREINEIRNQIGVETGKLTGWVEEALRTTTFDLVTKQGIADSYFYLIQQTQRIADVPTWIGQYEKSMAAGETEERAIEQADQAVRDAQGSGQIHDLAAVQRGTPAFKLWTNFYSFFSTTYNQSAEAISRTRGKLGKPGHVGRLAVDYLLLYTVPASVGFVLREFIRGGKDDDDESFLLELAKQNLSYMTGTMIGLRELSGAIQGYYGYEGPAGARGWATASKLLKQVGQGELDASFWKSLNDAAGIYFHYPSGQVRRTIEGIAALVEGRTKNPGVLVTGPPPE